MWSESKKSFFTPKLRHAYRAFLHGQSRRRCMVFKTQIEHLYNEMVAYRDNMRLELRDLPEGVLYVEQRKGRYYYSQRIPKGGNHKKEHRHGITDDTDTIFALVRKRYLLSALPIIEQNIEEMEAFVGNLRPADEPSVMKKYLAKYPQLADGIYFNRQDHKKWADSFEGLKGFYEEDLRSVSAKGKKMRSVGELYISSCLDKLDIPYRYEAPVNHPDLSYVPDFTIIRPRDDKLFYWEHFGKFDSDSYINDNVNKVSNYIRYGIVPWDNLIMTYNFQDGGLNAKLIDAMVDVWLV